MHYMPEDVSTDKSEFLIKSKKIFSKCCILSKKRSYNSYIG